MPNIMNPLGQIAGRFFRDENGASAIEYAIIAAGLSIVIAGVVLSLGQTVNNDMYQPVATGLKGS